MITREAIQYLMAKGLIEVKPEPVKIGPNSVDLRLGDTLKRYERPQFPVPVERLTGDHEPWEELFKLVQPLNNWVALKDPVGGLITYAIDPKNPPPLEDVPQLEDGGWLLVPGNFYLGSTLEETFCQGVIPHLDGRSTCGRLSIEAHKTAGVGDNGFRGRWTLEIEVTEPVIVRPGDRLFQIYFTPAWGEGLAIAIVDMMENRKGTLLDEDFYVQGGEMMPDGEPRDCGALFNLHDLYGQGEKSGGHHYQGSKEARGPDPLD